MPRPLRLRRVLVLRAAGVPCAAATLFAAAAALVRVRRTTPQRRTRRRGGPTPDCRGGGTDVPSSPQTDTGPVDVIDACLDSESPPDARVSLPPAAPPMPP